MDAGPSAFDVSLLHSGAPALIDFIRETIRSRGPVPFAWFMEQALYHRRHGYYSSGRAAIGRRGDYFTSVSVGPLFGRILAAQFAEIWAHLGRPPEFVIVEQGAHAGDFAADVLHALRERAPEFFAAVQYWIVEPFAVWQERQAEKLSGFGSKVSWRESIAELAPFSGVHFSNELLDSFPVHLVAMDGPTEPAWKEKYVVDSRDGFVFIDRPLSTETLARHLRKLPAPADGEYLTEVNLATLDWIGAVSAKLVRGCVLAVDYGYSREAYYSRDRTEGTLSCYARHRRLPSPLQNVGQADITAHVEWTSVVEQAEACGFQLAGFTDQHHFITAFATGDMRDEFGEDSPPQDRRTLQTLLHPAALGMQFQFLGLSKNAANLDALTGFRFARDARTELGVHEAAGA